MRARTSVGAVAEIATREVMVEALVQSGLADDVSSRRLLVQMVADDLHHTVSIPDQIIGRNHLIELVNACATQVGGMEALARALHTLRPGSQADERIRRLVYEPQVRDLLPAAELDLLRGWLVATHVPHLATLVRRAGGVGTSAAEFGENAWDAVRYLLDRNAGPDGFPPVLSFVELVACQLAGETGERLMRWNDEQARRLGLEPALRERRAQATRVAADVRLHLLIVVQHDGIDPERFLLSSWRQDDPDEWPPPAGDTVLVAVDELERRVDELVVSAERAWCGHSGPVALEIVLPRALLNLPVHRWYKEHDSGNPRPLCLDYPIVVRSLERMRSPHWHRVWRERWVTLVADPSPARIHFGRAADTSERYRVDAVLSEPQWVMMVLSAPPAAEALPGSDELTAALRSGLPGLFWHPSSTPDDLRDAVDRLMEGGLIDIAGRLQLLRKSRFMGRLADSDIARDLILLWDDPDRLVVLDQSHDQPPHDQPPNCQPPDSQPFRGDVTDEREWAS
jgi:hypothetical protein